jgi:hypothetical protein
MLDPSTQFDSAQHRLEADGLVTREGNELRTTRKWQGAMARAALRLYEVGDPGRDLRVPIASALLEIYGTSLEDEEIANLVETMLPVEIRALGLVKPPSA